MKSKKKLLLMGVGVMGALAMGVGATSTFAWYQVTASINIGTLTDSTTLVTDAHAALAEAPVTITMSGDITLRLTNSSGQSSYIANGNTYADTTGTKYSSFDLTATWTPTAPATPANYNGATDEFWVVPSGNVVILANNATDPGSAADPASPVPYLHVTCTITAGTPTLNYDKVWFAIRTNNPSGLEYLPEENVKGQVPDEWVASTSYSVGDVVLQSSKVYKCKTANSDSSFAEGKWERIDHGADDLSLTTTEPNT